MKPEYSVLDRVIGFFSPAALRDREIARYQLQEVSQARKYEAAKHTRLRKKREDFRSPDLIVGNAIESIRAQARHFDENFDLAVSVLNSMTAAIVGEGIRTSPMLRSPDGKLATETNKAVGEFWREWTKRPDSTGEISWGEAQCLMCRTWLRDGEAFSQDLIGFVPGHQHFSPVLYSLELIEPDFCPVGLSDASKRIIQGVRKTPFGAPEAYYFYKDDPRGTPDLVLKGTSIMKPSLVFPRLDDLNEVQAARVNHLKLIRRLRQTRGISVFAPVFTRLDDLKEFEESERIAARIGAAFAFAIQKNAEYQGQTTFETGKLRELGLVPGIIFDNLAPGETVESLKNERPSNQITAFRAAMMRATAGGVGASYSSIAKDYNGTYSAQRQEMIEAAIIYAMIRAPFIERYVDRVYRTFIDTLVTQGLLDLNRIDLSSIYHVEHRGQGIPYIDPSREVKADETAILAGLMSRTATILRRGGDPEEIRRQIEEERQRDTEQGLVFSSTASDVEPVESPDLDALVQEAIENAEAATNTDLE